MTKSIVLGVTLTLSYLMAIPSVTAARPSQTVSKKAAKEKCFGIPSEVENACTTGTEESPCPQLATTDHNKNDWRFVPRGTCEKLGGTKHQPLPAPADE